MILKHLKIMRYLLPVLFAFISLMVNGQSSDYELDNAPNLKNESIDQTNKSVNSAVDIPFIDDFTINHFPGNPDGNTILWEDESAFWNYGYGLNPPSVGVVTLEGLDANDYPYNSFAILNESGPADTLTSVDIDLSNTSGGLVLSFYYQAGGLGDSPEGADSLVLEFLNGSTGEWDWQWSQAGGIDNSAFDQFLIEVDGPDYLVNDFKFRFRNYATLSGSWDHWNIDYVQLDQNRTLSDSIPVDICFGEPVYTLLNNGYTSVPWSHYINSPSALVTPTKDVLIRNLRSQAALIAGTGVDVDYNGSSQLSAMDSQSPSIQPQSDQFITQEINSAPNNYFYAPGVDNVSADFDVTFTLTSSPNEIADNDQLKFTQRFQDYYDETDGTAEISFGISNFTGVGNVAYKVNAWMADSLDAVQISFYPAGTDSENGIIYISVWEDDGFAGSPGTLLYESSEMQNPIFVNDRNGYAVYDLEEKIYVDESYYIGFKQITTQKLPVGVDKSRDNNTDRFFYQVSGAWLPANLPGSTMMRPQYISDIIVDGLNELDADINVTLWPNPANNYLSIQSDESVTLDYVLIYDQLGKLVSEQSIDQNQIDTSFLPEGMYLVRMIGIKNNLSTTKKIVITH